MQSYANLFELPHTDAFFFDMFGVLWSGQCFYPNVLAVLEKLRTQGKKVYIISNQTITRDEFINKRTTQGFLRGIHYDDVITSGRVCFEALKNGLFEQVTGKKEYRFYALGVPNPALFEPVKAHQVDTMAEADVFYIGSIKDGSSTVYQETFIPLMQQALKRQIPAVCANPDRFVIMDTRKQMVQGAAARWYQQHGGQVVLLGKPMENIFEFALRVTGADKTKSVMVGDMLMTDIWGANRINMRSVLMTETGVSAYEMRTQQIDLNKLISQTAQEENAPESVFEPTFCIPCTGILPTT